MYDVLVVGAGPAGNNAALQLASRGYNVAVVDRRYAIGEKLCSGIVGAECLRKYPAEPHHILRSERSAKVTAPSGKTLQVSRDETQAYVIDRVAYVASFAERAQRAGAEYLLGHSLRDLTVHRDGVQAIVVNGGPPKVIEAQAAVLATGFGSRLTRSLGLGAISDYTIGVQAEVSVSEAVGIELHLGKEVAPGFFAWLVPTTTGKALLGLMARRGATEWFKTLLASFRKMGKVKDVIKPAARWGIPMKPLSRAYRDRVLVVGDAAGHVKPSTGGGIYYSLMTSDIAATTLDRALQAGDLSESFLSSYEREWTALIGGELQVGRRARFIFDRLGDRQIDYIISNLAADGRGDEIFNAPGVSFDWHSSIIKPLLLTPILQKAMRFAGSMAQGIARR